MNERFPKKRQSQSQQELQDLVTPVEIQKQALREVLREHRQELYKERFLRTTVYPVVGSMMIVLVIYLFGVKIPAWFNWYEDTSQQQLQN
ncbi:hypothetical protein [Myxosarcina sp. GI1]|uniref:hypothetical protein n=1 Tax=Myxosarcina sp. GI1 TaxID=1541065 RepID=UPI00056B2FED|nr:hypothetical protein [Myxosarcina sp. GI1]